MNAFQIEREILKHVRNSSAKSFSEFYVGITNNVDQRLFKEHGVNKKEGTWIYRKAITILEARSAENLLLNKGMKGGSGGGSDDSLFVYCYRITNYTVE